MITNKLEEEPILSWWVEIFPKANSGQISEKGERDTRWGGNEYPSEDELTVIYEKLIKNNGKFRAIIIMNWRDNKSIRTKRELKYYNWSPGGEPRIEEMREDQQLRALDWITRKYREHPENVIAVFDKE